MTLFGVYIENVNQIVEHISHFGIVMFTKGNRDGIFTLFLSSIELNTFLFSYFDLLFVCIIY